MGARKPKWKSLRDQKNRGIIQFDVDIESDIPIDISADVNGAGLDEGPQEPLIPADYRHGSHSLSKESAKAAGKSYSKLLKKILEEYDFLVAKGGRTSGNRRSQQDKRTQILSIDKEEFVRPLVRNQMSMIRERFGDVISENEIVDSVYKHLKSALDDAVKNQSGVRWVNNEVVVEGDRDNFKVLQAIFTKLRNNLKQVGTNLLHRSKAQLSRAQIAANNREASIIFAITGTDVRGKAEGGDIEANYLEDVDIGDGIVQVRIKESTAISKRLVHVAQKRGSGFQIGHIFGPGLGNIAAFAGTEDGLPEFFSFFSPQAQELLIKIREEAIRVDGNYEVDVRLTRIAGKELGKVSTTIVEGTGANALTGGQLTRYVIAIRQIVQAEFADIIDKYRGSAPLGHQILYRAANIVLTGDNKTKSINIKKSGKKSITVKVKKAVYKVDLKPGLRTRSKPKSKASRQPSDLKKYIGLINSKLHDKIRENMGAGNSKQLLNYRTGRFAKSAKLQNITLPKGQSVPIAAVKYMRYPYGVFEPTGRLHKAGRDPHHIFGRSIRQILQEEKIGNFARVRVNLRG